MPIPYNLDRYCKECELTNEDHEELGCIGCGICLDDFHCHTKENDCIPYIKDCQEHYEKCGLYGCALGCHDECSCKNP